MVVGIYGYAQIYALNMQIFISHRSLRSNFLLIHMSSIFFQHKLFDKLRGKS